MGGAHSLSSAAAGGRIDSTEPELDQVGGEARSGPTAAFPIVSPSPFDPQMACGAMVWGLSLALSKSATTLRRRRRRRRLERELGETHDDNNKSWLLADARPEPEIEPSDPQSVHSSFRFSFGSQTEAEDLAEANSGNTTVLLLVNVEGEKVGKSSELQSLERSISLVAGGLVRFSYREIRAATRGFSRGRELGRGAVSRVYEGRVGVSRSAVAIKRVGGGHDRESAKAFCRELLITGSLRHPNVVPLVGFCIDAEGLYVVYKFVSRGSLDHHLHHHHEKGGRRRKVLSWEVRYRVAVGVARAVEYLHYGTNKCVVHRDIKPSNILLSSNKSPKLCDFGLATWTRGPSVPFLCKAVKGTFGYLAPEYFQHGKLSDKTDIYAFGVVLLELITGRKAIDRSRPLGEENLVLWAKPLLARGEGAIEKLVDPRLKPGSYTWSEMSRVVCAAAACVSSEESSRPSIERVIGMLQGEEETCTDWSIFTANGCLAGYRPQLHSPTEKCDMKGHLALAMLGVSDAEDDDLLDP